MPPQPIVRAVEFERPGKSGPKGHVCRATQHGPVTARFAGRCSASKNTTGQFSPSTDHASAMHKTTRRNHVAFELCGTRWRSSSFASTFAEY